MIAGSHEVGDLSGPGARAELFSWAAARETFHPSRLVQEWLDAHGDARPAESAEAMRTAIELEALGGPCLDATGRDALRLPTAVRLQVLERLGGAASAAVLGEAPSGSLTLTERLFAQLLAGRRVSLDRNNRAQMVALAEAARWTRAAGVDPQVTEQELTASLARHDFLQALGGEDLHRFIGRVPLRRTLEQHWMRPRALPEVVLLDGPGGIGKSLAVARFIADVLESEDERKRPHAVFHLDFDRAPLQKANQVSVLKDLIRQAGRWVSPDRAEALENLSHDLGKGQELDALSEQVRGVSFSMRDLASAAAELVELLVPRGGGRLLVFADSFEQVEQYDDFTAGAVQEVAQLLAVHCERLLLVYAARVFLHPVALSPHQPLRLREFSAREADSYLINEAARAGLTVDAKQAKRVRDVVGQTPLALRLAVGLLEKSGGEMKAADWAPIVAASPELVQAAVYDRLLRRLKDRDAQLRAIALPSMLLRRITPALIREVLAPACGVVLVSGDEAGVMQRMQAEWRLFVTADGDEELAAGVPVVRHRHEVRTALLPNLERSLELTRVRAVNEAAVRYYARRAGTIVRAEELYHRLRLDQPATELELRWDPNAASLLRSALPELPPTARSFLRSRLGGATRASFGQVLTSAQGAEPLAGFDSALEELRLYARKVLQSGSSVKPLLEQLERRVLDGSGPQLADIYGAALMRAGRHERVLQLAREMAGNSGTRHGEATAGVLAIAAGLLEGKQALGEAQQFWILALVAARGLDPIRRLPCLVGSARLRRKVGTGAMLRAQELDAALAATHVAARDLREHTGLARETCAELGELLAEAPGAGSGQGSPLGTMKSVLVSILEGNQAFPSTVRDPVRLSAVSLRLAGRELNARTLDSVATNIVYSGVSDTLNILVDVLREEVDWTLRKAVEPEAQPVPA